MKIIGHRGASGLAPENTLASIQAALGADVDEIEMDIRISADGIPVLCHDPSLLRLTGKNIGISATDYSDLVAVKPDLCTLDAAITTVGRRVPIIVEVKSGVAVAPVVAVMRKFLQRGWESQDFFLASFSQKTLRSLHGELPDIPTVVNEPFLGIRAQYRARQVGALRLSMNHRYLWAPYVSFISKRYALYPYTLNDPAKARRWAKRGIAGVITDTPGIYHSTDPKS